MGMHVGPPQELVDTGVDYLVIGSGFGGSVMAATLAEAVGKQGTVCLFERGKAYPPGSFPRTPLELDASLWNPDSERRGMFQVWSFPGIDAITASGLGGGSLIYANVMLEKPKDWFTQPTPDGEGTETWSFGHHDLAPHYDEVRSFLKVQTLPEEFVGTHSPKTGRFREVSPDAELAPLAVRFTVAEGTPAAIGAPLPSEGYENIHGDVQRTTCRMVGECDVGCNYGAKSSMDHTYLSKAAADCATVCIHTEVCEIRRLNAGSGHLFNVGYVVHPQGADGNKTGGAPEIQWIKAKRVVLAAGTLNTTLLMLRNTANLGIPWREPIGERFCGNGDLLGFALPGFGDEGLFPSGGPVITAYHQLGDGRRRLLLQDGGVPDLTKWDMSLDEVGKLIWKLGREWVDRMTGGSRGLRPASQDGFGWPRWPLPLLGMGADTPDGRLRWNRTADRLTCDWTIHSSRPHFDEVLKQMESLSARLRTRFLLKPRSALRKVITVHPLGGCPADTSTKRGVVDSYGRVRSVPGLWITDGSVMPGPIGANPSLTIAAFARRAGEELLKEGLGTPSTPELFTASGGAGRSSSPDRSATTP